MDDDTLVDESFARQCSREDALTSLDSLYNTEKPRSSTQFSTYGANGHQALQDWNLHDDMQGESTNSLHTEQS
jgi:hypothetical protein